MQNKISSEQQMIDMMPVIELSQAEINTKAIAL